MGDLFMWLMFCFDMGCELFGRLCGVGFVMGDLFHHLQIPQKFSFRSTSRLELIIFGAGNALRMGMSNMKFAWKRDVAYRCGFAACHASRQRYHARM